METNTKSRNKLFALYSAWLIPVIFFSINPSYEPEYWPTYLALLISILLGLLDKKFFAFCIPFIVTLGPLAISARPFNLLPPDLYILVCFVIGLVAFVLKGKLKIRLIRGDHYLIGIVLVVLISYLLSFEIFNLSKSIVSWVIIITVFALTRSLLSTSEDLSNYFTVIIISSFFLSLIGLSSFYSGINLSDFMDPALERKSKLEQEDFKYFLRLSSFYANSLYLIGPAAFLSLIRTIEEKKIFQKLILGSLTVFFIVILLMMQEKTGLVALFLSILMLFLMKIALPNKKRKRMNVNNYLMVFLASLFLAFSYVLISDLPLYNLTFSSFAQRMCIFSSTIDVLYANPQYLFFGFGPDSSLLLNNDFTSQAQTGCINDGIYKPGQEGAIDGGWMTFLFEYGLIFVLLLLIFTLSSLKIIYSLLRKYSSVRPILFSLFGVLIFINIAALSDVVGTSKMSWIIAQNYALIGICTTKDFLKKTEKRERDKPTIGYA